MPYSYSTLLKYLLCPLDQTSLGSAVLGNVRQDYPRRLQVVLVVYSPNARYRSLHRSHAWASFQSAAGASKFAAAVIVRCAGPENARQARADIRNAQPRQPPRCAMLRHKACKADTPAGSGVAFLRVIDLAPYRTLYPTSKGLPAG